MNPHDLASGLFLGLLVSALVIVCLFVFLAWEIKDRKESEKEKWDYFHKYAETLAKLEALEKATRIFMKDVAESLKSNSNNS